MKKINKLSTLILLPFLLLLNSCWDPVFYEIRKDVVPESATVSGNIGQITRFTMNSEEYFFLSANGGLRYKKANDENHGSWASMETPFPLMTFDFDSTGMKGCQLIGVFASSDTLYLIAAPYAVSTYDGITNPEQLQVWAHKNTGSWEENEWVHINKNSSINYFPYEYDSLNEVHKSKFYLFQTNAPKADHRHFYLLSYIYNEESKESKETYFEFKGTDVPENVTDTVKSNIKYGSHAYSAAWFNDKVLFFDAKAAITDENSKDDAKNIYFASGTNLCRYLSSGEYETTCSTGTPISSLALAKDSILMGLGNITSTSSDNGGIKRVLLDSDGKPDSYTSDFKTNANFQISSAYTVLSLLNATPEKKEIDSALYASITFSGYSGLYDNIGLWSYYPSRGNWNRE